MTAPPAGRVRGGGAVSRAGSMALLAAACLLAAGCAGEVTDAGEMAGDPTPACAEAAGHSDLAWIEASVFATGCAAFAACHQGDAPSAGGLDLTAGAAFDSLVGAPSLLAPGMDLVSPGSPEESYLMVILGQYGADDPRLDPEVGTMPADSPLLCPEKREAIARWILALGAP